MLPHRAVGRGSGTLAALAAVWLWLMLGPIAFAQESKGYALLVGVDRYDDQPRLTCCSKDATALARLLRTDFGFQTTLMTQDRGRIKPEFSPDALRIRTQLTTVAEACGESDTLLVMFSGHGTQDVKRRDVTICPADFRGSQRSSQILLSEIYRVMSASSAKQKILILDACRALPEPDAEPAKPDQPAAEKAVPSIPEPPEGVMVLLSCKSGEMSYESPTFGHGTFMHFLLKELNAATEKGESIDLAKIMPAVAEATRTHVEKQDRQSQQPQLLVGTGARGVLNPPGGEELRKSIPLMNQSDAKAAEELLSAALEQSPESVRLLIDRSAMRLLRGKLDLALADAEAARKLAPDEPRAWEARAAVRLEQGDLLGAKADCDFGVELDPRCAIVYATRSAVRTQLGELNGALDDADTAVALAPNRMESWRARASAADYLYQDEWALAAALEVLKRSPRAMDMHQLAGRLKETFESRAAAEEHYRAALARAEELLQADSEHATARRVKIDTLAALRRYPEALALCEQWRKQEPNSPWEPVARAGVLTLQNRDAEAIAAYTEAIARLPQLGALRFQRSRCYRRRFQEDRAKEDVAAGQKLAPGAIEGFDERARLLGRDEPQQAIDAVNELVGRYPLNWRVYVIRSEHLLYLGRPERVQADLDLSIQLAPKHPMAWMHRGYALSELGQAEESQAAYEKAIAMIPKSAFALNWRGYTRLWRFDFPGAVEDLTRALAADPESPETLSGLGQALYEVGRYSEALQRLQQAIDRHGTEENLWLFRGKARLMLGDESGIDDWKTSDTYVSPDSEMHEGMDLMAWWRASDQAEDPAGVSEMISVMRREALYRLVRARIYANGKQYERALADLDVAAKQVPQSPLVEILRARVYFAMKKPESGMAALAAAQKLAPKQPYPAIERSRWNRRFNQWDLALADLNAALESTGTTVELLGERAEFHLQRGDYPAALADCQAAFKLNPERKATLLLRGMVLLRQNRAADLPMAMADIRHGLDLPPAVVTSTPESQARVISIFLNAREIAEEENVFPRLTAQLQLVNNNRRGAVEQLEQTQQQNPADLDSQRLLGTLQVELGQTEAGFRNLRAALAGLPNQPVFAESLALALAKRAAAKRESDAKQALADLEEAITLLPKNGRIRLQRGDWHRDAGELELAVKDYCAVVDFGGEMAALARAKRGLLRLASGKIQDALADLEPLHESSELPRLESTSTDPAEQLVQTLAALRRGDLAGAEQLRKSFATDEPKWAFLRAFFAQTESTTGKLDLAQQHFSEALQLGYDRAWVRARLVEVEWERGQPEAALGHAEWLVRNDPVGNEPKRLLVETLLRLRRGEQARELLLKARTAAPEDLELLAMQARFHRLTGNGDSAIADYTALLRKQPDRLLWRQLRGEIRLRAGQYPEALEDFQAVLQRRPRDASAVCAVIEVMLEQGQLLDAQRRLDAFAQSDPNAGASVERMRVLLAIKQQNYGIAKEKLAALMEQSPHSAANFRLRATLERAQGRLEAAKLDEAKAEAIESALQVGAGKMMP
ncbi:tetratricopeptide repeat protein [Tuwongella immobilis]|uniref:Peptidase C14 caspase domain-containing protein n=1 Tax=Tuwongella immobilis TaxID=692036 RepID=A0A6C2YJN2_9BACT|nr:tetratricopeptide repeat protein [Tuwongella immobilis]VIP01172.1 peptidase c14 caspase catalytic subunit p20 : Peptidase C14 caspase catalytic subunit p20 OS=Methylobacterium nodulans (strain ORS2060 / LMG 21967) GN=Mnod_6182 PE=4 SV=1: Peptidase_C14: TPR_9: TPR_2: TPR_11: TPR_9: TPR_1: TPR_19 [Tuwongella immobilis]VTR97770.1 peptidase c14 caspase catalytic subunit p20 : Peptidase C14 caspase catalytic subunit p20 OS=Methylobacterium nodulans (strain ORS2060 / LMG 21967) GN=Mnod_6182 PE=4 SV=